MAEYGNLPFREQIQFFRDKVNLPTAAWTDIWEGMHSRAFVVAGAMKDELLTDLRGAVDKAIGAGTTLAQFRKDFDALVEKHGWAYNGGRNWRTRVIFDTNLRQSYSSGREAQMRDPDLRARRPYGLYRHGNSEHPRPEHLAWDGTVLPLDDPWWETHTPMNGWGCTCRKMMVNQGDVDRMGLSVSESPEVKWREVTVGKNGPSPRTVKVPEGIDPGFGYNPGTAAWGRPLAEQTMDAWRAQGADAWESLTPGTPAAYDRPSKIPLDAPPKPLGQQLTDRGQVQKAIEEQIGGSEKVFLTPGGVAVNVNAEILARHLDVDRSRYIAWLADLLTNPFEQWLAFEQHKGSGKVVLRTRLIKAYEDSKGVGQLLVAQAHKGQLEAWTVVPANPIYLNKQRMGKLLFGR
jgi:hypothetical protein